MADKISADRRSANMGAIRSRDTRIERLLRQSLRSLGLTGYRLDRRDLPGRPDIAFIGHRLAVFVDGCFWHGCPRCYVAPKTATAYWNDKLARNQARDRSADDALISLGWVVLRFWEHEVEADSDECARRVEAALRGSAHSETGSCSDSMATTREPSSSRADS